MEEELKKCEKEKDEYLNGWKRERADFNNYKKEEAQRFEEFAKYSQSEIIKDLIAVLDSFNLATDLTDGARMVKQQLEEVLKRQGLEEIKVQPAQLFDPAFHEAISEEESGQPPGTIAGEIARGYSLNGRVIRPAKVKIAAERQVKSS